jgi:hypothetical protein
MRTIKIKFEDVKIGDMLVAPHNQCIRQMSEKTDYYVMTKTGGLYQRADFAPDYMVEILDLPREGETWDLVGVRLTVREICGMDPDKITIHFSREDGTALIFDFGQWQKKRGGFRLLNDLDVTLPKYEKS